MPVVHCHFCDLTYQAPDAAAGKQVACRRCFRKLDVPRNESPSDSGPKLKAEETTAPRRAEPPPKPKPAAPPAKAVARPAPKAKPSQPAQSDRWSFDLDEFDSEAVESEEFESLPPAVGKKKKSRHAWKWQLPTLAPPGLKIDPEFAPYENNLEFAAWLNILAAVVMLPLSLLEPPTAFEVLRVLFWVCAGLYFIDCTFAGGLVRVFLVFSVPGLLYAFPVSYSWRIAILSVYSPYFLYVAVIRFRHAWPVELLFATTVTSSWLLFKAVRDRRWWDAIQEFKTEWLSWLY
jgi:hypothetical protein